MIITSNVSDIPFEASFRIVSAQVLVDWENQQTLPPSFYNCPTWCYERKEKRNDYCRSCPVDQIEKEFRRETIGLLNQRVGEEWKKYSYEQLIAAVYHISSIADKNDPDWTRETARLVRIFQSEKAKFSRTENYNRTQALNKPT